MRATVINGNYIGYLTDGLRDLGECHVITFPGYPTVPLGLDNTIVTLSDGDPALIAAAIKESRPDVVLSLSSHDDRATRDAIAAQMLPPSIRFIGNSLLTAVTCGDKILSKHLMRLLGVNTPEIIPMTEVTCGKVAPPYVLKSRCECGGRGVRVMLTPARETDLSQADYIETFISGIEVTAFVIADGVLTDSFPLVEKGSTLDARHPMERLRICPARVTPVVEGRIREAVTAMVRVLRPFGVLDFDFVVTPNEDVYLLEVNARVSGSVPILTAATGVNILERLLSLGTKWVPAVIEPRYIAAEVPITREANMDQVLGLRPWQYHPRATSDSQGRAIIRADNVEQISDLLVQYQPFMLGAKRR